MLDNDCIHVLKKWFQTIRIVYIHQQRIPNKRNV